MAWLSDFGRLAAAAGALAGSLPGVISNERADSQEQGLIVTSNSFPMVLQPLSGPSHGAASSVAWTSSGSSTLDSSGGDTLCDCSSGMHGGASGAPEPAQQLLTVGSRMWGSWWDGRGLLRVKIYDFAIYVDGQAAQLAMSAAAATAGAHAQPAQRGGRRRARRRAAQEQLTAELPSVVQLSSAADSGPQGGGGEFMPVVLRDSLCTDPGAPPLALVQRCGNGNRSTDSGGGGAGEATRPLCEGVPRLAAGCLGDGAPDTLKASDSVGMSLLLRASRDVPLQLLGAEYDKVLRRRLERVGGDPDDPALRQLLASFCDATRLPRAALSQAGDAVRRGAVIVFERRPGGALRARAGSAVLGEVVSPKLGEALFDLYLGDTPVSKRAKAGAADTLARLVADARSAYVPAPGGGEALRCSGPDLTACVLQLRE